MLPGGNVSLNSTPFALLRVNENGSVAGLIDDAGMMTAWNCTQSIPGRRRISFGQLLPPPPPPPPLHALVIVPGAASARPAAASTTTAAARIKMNASERNLDRWLDMGILRVSTLARPPRCPLRAARSVRRAMFD